MMYDCKSCPKFSRSDMKRGLLKFALSCQLFSIGLVLPTVATAAENFSAAVDPCSKYEFFWRARPAFLQESTVGIEAAGGTARLTVTYEYLRDTRRSEELTLTSDASQAFCEAL